MEPLVVPSVSAASGLATYITRMASIRGLSATYLVEAGSELHRSLPDQCDVLFTDGSAEDMARMIRDHAYSHDGVQTHGSRALLAARKARIRSKMIGHVLHELPWGLGARGWAELGLTPGTLRAANGAEAAKIPRRLGLPCFSVLPPIVGKIPVLPRSEARQRLGLPATRISIGVIGRLSPVKAPILAVEAIAQLPPTIQEQCDLVFAGDGPLHDQIVDAARRHGVSVHLPGRIPDAGALVTGLDVLVVPSPHETFGLSMAEALLAGVPVAATRSPGSQLLQSAGASLDLAEPRPAELARVIESALSGPHFDDSEKLLGSFGREALSPVYIRYFRELAIRAA